MTGQEFTSRTGQGTWGDARREVGGGGVGEFGCCGRADFAGTGELNAALGLAQTHRLDEIIAKRQNVANAYMQRLGTHRDLIVPTIDEDVNMSWFVFVVRLAPSYTSQERDRIIKGLRAHDIGASDYFPCIHLQPHFRELGFGPGMFPICESVSNRTIALPFFNNLGEREIDLVCGTLELMLSRENIRRS